MVLLIPASILTADHAAEGPFGPADVRPPQARVVLVAGDELDGLGRADDVADHLGGRENRHLVRPADVFTGPCSPGAHRSRRMPSTVSLT